MLPRLLVWSDSLGPEQRWRLTDFLFSQTRPLIEGTVAQAVVLLFCLVRTGAPIFAWLGGTTLVWLLVRLLLRRHYWRGRGIGDPRRWARPFLWGSIGTALIWGVTSWLVLRETQDTPLQIVTLTVQAGWIAGLAVRNAVSPISVLGSTLAANLPSAAAFLLTDKTIYELASLFYLMQMTANLSIGAYLAHQTVSLLISEEALASANAQLSGSCAALENANHRLARLSATDGLTGIGNRRAFDEALETEWLRAARDHLPLSLLMLDVDLFKRFNDRYGHPSGDSCLRTIARLLETGLRHPPDFAGRFGGEEFVALLPGIEQSGALAVAERLRQAVAAAALPHEESPFGFVTVSVGAACLHPEPGARPQSLVAAADAALYRAKQSGRNCVALGETKVAKAA